MQNKTLKEKWLESKYEQTKKGHWRGSRNSRELSISSRLVADLVARWYEKVIPQYVQGHLLDLGCGKAPLYKMYAPYTTDVTCVDWKNSLHGNPYVDITCDLNKPLELASSSFNAIILSDVLEHIAEPNVLFSEMCRILCPGGKIIMNVPFLYWVHEQPYDYYRYTEFAIVKLAAEHQLHVVELTPFGGKFTVMADLMAKSVVGLPLLGKFLAKMIQNITPLSWAKRKSRTNFPLGYFIILQKTTD